MKVSVCITTYNHAPYIRQALDSVLGQKTDFDFEVILGEDDSTDGTREIVKEYASQYPQIRLFLNDRKNVIYINGRPTGRWNFMNNLKHAKGEYVALLDGDDYWTDPLKLQKQVDTLESNPEFVLCCHNVRVVTDDDEKGMVRYKNDQPVMTVKDLILENRITTNAALFRNHLFSEFPPWMWEEPKMDFALFVLIAQYGHIYYLKDVSSVYRIHGGGVYSTYSRHEDFELSVAFLKRLDRYFDRKYHGSVKDAIANRHFRLAGHYLRADRRASALKYLVLSFIKKPWGGKAFSSYDFNAMLFRIFWKRE